MTEKTISEIYDAYLVASDNDRTNQSELFYKLTELTDLFDEFTKCIINQKPDNIGQLLLIMNQFPSKVQILEVIKEILVDNLTT